MGFNDLRFVAKEHGLGGSQAIVFFPNGYGVSIITGYGAYGGDKGLYEIAVLKGTEGKSSLCYDTPITDDVIGHLSPNDVTDYLKKIESLPEAP